MKIINNNCYVKAVLKQLNEQCFSIRASLNLSKMSFVVFNLIKKNIASRKQYDLIKEEETLCGCVCVSPFNLKIINKHSFETGCSGRNEVDFSIICNLYYVKNNQRSIKGPGRHLSKSFFCGNS